MNGTPDDDVYDEEAYIGTEEGDIMDGRVVDDLNDDDAPDYAEDSEDEQPLEGIPEDEPEGEAGSAYPARPDASVQRLTRHGDGVLAVAWSHADPYRIASGGVDDKGFLWHLGADDEAVELPGHEDSVVALAFDPTGATLATASMDGAVKLWDAATGAQAGTLDGPTEAVEWLQWHPKGTVLLAGSEDMTTWMFNAAQRTCMQVFTGHAGSVTAGGFTPDGKVVVTAGGDGDGSLRLWNPKTGECTAAVLAGHGFHDAQGVTCLAVSDDGALVLTGGVDGAAVVTSVATGRPVAKLTEHAASVEGVAFANGLQLAVSAGMDGKAVVWDLAADAARGTCAHPEGIVCLAMQHRGPLFATGCLDGAVRVWDVRTTECVAELGGHSDVVQCLAWSPDDTHLASGSDDHSVRVFQCVA